MSGDADRLVLEALAVLVRQIVREEIREHLDAAPRAEGFIGTAEAARRAGVTADTILAWIDRGLLAATRPGGTKQWRIRPTDLDAVLSEHAGEQPVRLDEKRDERARKLAEAVRNGGGRG